MKSIRQKRRERETLDKRYKFDFSLDRPSIQMAAEEMGRMVEERRRDIEPLMREKFHVPLCKNMTTAFSELAPNRDEIAAEGIGRLYLTCLPDGFVPPGFTNLECCSADEMAACKDRMKREHTSLDLDAIALHCQEEDDRLISALCLATLVMTTEPANHDPVEHILGIFGAPDWVLDFHRQIVAGTDRP